MRIEGDNASVGDGAGSYGGGHGVLGFINAGTNPSGTPSGGGVQWAQSGAGHWKGSSGTNTTFGPADPHCPRCGGDHVTEHSNALFDRYTFVCLRCLVEMVDLLDQALLRTGVDVGVRTHHFTKRERRFTFYPKGT